MDHRSRSFGCAFVIAGLGLFGLAIVIGLRGGTVFVGGGEPGSLILTASLVAAAVGFAILGLTGPAPFDRTGSRVGLGLLAVGLAGNVLTGIYSAGSTVDPLESLPILLVSGLGNLAVVVGVIVTAASLVRSAGA